MDIRVGDRLVSSGLAQRYPYGYPVGTVTRVADQPGTTFSQVWVKPSGHIQRTRLVLLYWQKHRTKGHS